MDNTLISIIIPVYNVECYIEECLNSVVPQVLSCERNIEILLIDDGSNDKSGQICDIYYEKYPEIIRVFHNSNQGLLLTRRFGYRHAVGKYILNCDSDDTVESNMIGLLINIIEKETPDVIIYNMNIYDGNYKRTFFSDIFTDISNAFVDNVDVYREYLSSYSIVSLCCKCYKASCLNVTQDYSAFSSISNGEDTLQSLEIYSNAHNFYYIDFPLYNYRVASGMTSKFDSKYFESFARIIEEIEKNVVISKVEDFDGLLTFKVFSTVGRAITQSRYGNIKDISWHINYLKSIGESQLVRKYCNSFYKICKNIKIEYRILGYLLIHRRYNAIRTLLVLKNLI